MDYLIITGDCIAVMATMEESSVDAIVTDPPYGIGFMSKGWDDLPPGQEWAEACLRVLKPGGHILSFGGTRTYHRLTVALEDAGFEIRDCLMWLYGQGFPKSHNVANSIDKLNGHPNRGRAIPTASQYQASDRQEENKLTGNPVPPYEARSEEAKEWEGWGTALKPAWEPIVMARNPMGQTVARNVLENGTGALNIDGCRMGTNGGTTRSGQADYPTNADGSEDRSQHWARVGHTVVPLANGRWPANLLIDAEVAAELGGDTARYFYCAKASKAERNAGLEDWEDKPPAYEDHRPNYRNTKGGVKTPYAGPGRSGVNFKNNHPTVKPLALMRWLVRMVTPPGGTVLDPFVGSGTTGVAALQEGFDFLGIEREAEYVQIAEARIQACLKSSED